MKPHFITMDQVRIADIVGIKLSTLCLECWPCEHSMELTLRNGTTVRPQQMVNAYDLLTLYRMANLEAPDHICKASNSLNQLNEKGYSGTMHIDYADQTFIYKSR